jgi:serine/threonine protein kinase
LFIKVCQAIQHAHQKGIIHRDIKPSNILVTFHDDQPVPKVIDFGIAKATEGRLTDATVYTQMQQFIGTPAYMSPEQARMSGLDYIFFSSLKRIQRACSPTIAVYGGKGVNDWLALSRKTETESARSLKAQRVGTSARVIQNQN